MNIGDKVKIINTEDIWEGKTGTISNIGEEVITDSGEDITPVSVIVEFETKDGELKHVRQLFNMSDLEQIQVEESLEGDKILVEAMVDVDLPQFDNENEFKKFFVGVDGVFKGFDMDEIFIKHETKEGEWDYSEEDKEQAEWYEKFNNQPCTILDLDISGFDPFENTYYNFQNSYWQIKVNDEVLDNVYGGNIDLYPQIDKEEV